VTLGSTKTTQETVPTPRVQTVQQKPNKIKKQPGEEREAAGASMAARFDKTPWLWETGVCPGTFSYSEMKKDEQVKKK
jgi:hypothetical protein